MRIKSLCAFVYLYNNQSIDIDVTIVVVVWFLFFLSFSFHFFALPYVRIRFLSTVKCKLLAEIESRHKQNGNNNNKRTENRGRNLVQPQSQMENYFGMVCKRKKSFSLICLLFFCIYIIWECPKCPMEWRMVYGELWTMNNNMMNGNKYVLIENDSLMSWMKCLCSLWKGTLYSEWCKRYQLYLYGEFMYFFTHTKKKKKKKQQQRKHQTILQNGEYRSESLMDIYAINKCNIEIIRWTK